MRKSIFITIFIWALLLMGIGQLDKAIAEVNIKVGINVPPPPPLVIPAPPSMYVIPRTYVYFAPEVEMDVFFYHGYWYRPHQGHWYRSENYNEHWVYISPKKVPTVLLDLPPNFRHVPPGHRHIPYGHLKKNWSTWEKEKYWEKHGGKEWHGNEKWEHKGGKGKGKGKEKHND